MSSRLSNVVKPVRVGVDMRPTEAGFKAHSGRGTGRYTSELTNRLCLLSQDTPSIDIVPIGSDALKGNWFEQILVSWAPLGKNTLEHQFLMPRRFGRVEVDLVHFFAHGDAAMWCSQPYVVTVLDLIPLRFPDLYRARKTNWRFKFGRYLEYLAVKNAQGIIAISEATKRDVVSLLGIPEHRIEVVHLGVNSDFVSRPLTRVEMVAAKQEARVRLGLPIDDSLLLYVGGIDARKNVGFLLDILSNLKRIDSIDSPKLVMAGAYEKDDRYSGFLSEIKRLGLEESVISLGYVPEDHLLALYHAADVFVFPSIYEGFGLPVLEAMSSGIPVIAGRNSSIPEVCGDAVPMVPDNDTKVWIEEIASILSNEERQLSLSQAGVERAKLFSWNNAAEQTMKAYMKFAGHNMV